MVGCLLCWTQCPIIPAGKAYWHLINNGTTHWCRWFFCSCHIKYGFIRAPWLGLTDFLCIIQVSDCMPAAPFCTLPALALSNFLWGCFILIRPPQAFDLLTMSPTVLPPSTRLANEVVTWTSRVKDGSCRDSTPFHSGTQTFPRAPQTFRIPLGFLLFPVYPSSYLTTFSLSRTVYINRCPIIHRLA